MFKRAFDVFAAASLLIFTLPLLAVAAVLIKLGSDGPVIFRQDRMGRGFVRFRLFKLRTMNLRGVGTAYTLGADPRITRVGRWLRRYKIDELPQLWNVLRGEMSMVGPRPVIPELTEEFQWGYSRLLAVRPGLTDPASLKYCNETEILESIADANRYFKKVITPDKIRISLEYLQRRNAWTDIVVLARTARALASRAFRKQITLPDPVRPDRAALSIVASSVRSKGAKAEFKNVPSIGDLAIPLGVVKNPMLVQEVSKVDSVEA